MNNATKENKYIEIRSLTLLQRLNEARCLKSLAVVTIDREDEQKRPIYLFNDYNGRVTEVKNGFVSEYTADDRSMDDVELWKDYDSNMFIVHTDYEKVKSRNLFVLADAFDNGLYLKLRFVGKDDDGRTVYTFFKCNEMVEIKTERDRQSYENYLIKTGKAESDTNGK